MVILWLFMVIYGYNTYNIFIIWYYINIYNYIITTYNHIIYNIVGCYLKMDCYPLGNSFSDHF